MQVYTINIYIHSFPSRLLAKRVSILPGEKNRRIASKIGHTLRDKIYVALLRMKNEGVQIKLQIKVIRFLCIKIISSLLYAFTYHFKII